MDSALLGEGGGGDQRRLRSDRRWSARRFLGAFPFYWSLQDNELQVPLVPLQPLLGTLQPPLVALQVP